MLSALLSSNESTTTGSNIDWVTWVILAVFIVIIVVFFVFSSRRNKKKQEEAQQLMDAVKPGNKVKTIGGICGIVVEVDEEENTFVLETGSEASGKSYMKFDRQAIYQTDAVVEEDNAKDEKSEEGQEQAPAAEDEPFAEVRPDDGQAPAEESADKAEDGE